MKICLIVDLSTVGGIPAVANLKRSSGYGWWQGPRNAQIRDSRKALPAFAQIVYVGFFEEGVKVKI